MKILLTSDLHANFNDKTHLIHNKFWNKIKFDHPDLEQVHILGDLGMTRLQDVDQCLKSYREIFPNMPTFIQYGNHDYWDQITPLNLVIKSLDELASKYNCIWLNGKVDVTYNLTVFGFDGWYNYTHPPTNDYHWLYDGWLDFRTLQKKADNEWEQLVKSTATKLLPRPWILQTHFPSFAQYKTRLGEDDYSFNANKDWYEFIIKTFDIYLTGHSHRDANYKDGNCLVLNAGSDYNMPKYKIFEI